MKKKKTPNNGIKTLFDHLKHIISVQNKKYFDTLTESDIKTFDVYMIQRFLSMNSDWIDLINYIAQYSSGLSKKQFYLLIIELIPKTTKTYYKYIRKYANRVLVIVYI